MYNYVTDIEGSNKMKLNVLVDNYTFIDHYYYGEPAVSFHIEDEETRILFDVGYSDLFIKNAKALNLPLDHINYITLSHGHDDHTGGLPYYLEQFHNNRISVIAHPDALNEKVLEDIRIGSPISKHQLNTKCKLLLSKHPQRVTKHLIFLGEIPASNSFEARNAIGKRLEENRYVDDYVLEDSALVYQGELGIYIITGCSHSGICNIIEYAKQVCNTDNILGIIGGFHLFDVNDQVHNTINYLQNNNVRELYPCHCTSFDVKCEINKYIPVKEVGVGLILNWN